MLEQKKSLLQEIGEIKDLLLKIVHVLLTLEDDEMPYRDARYVMDRVGISESTLLRCQQNGHITVAKTIKNRKYYRDKDVERLRNIYWGKP